MREFLGRFEFYDRDLEFCYGLAVALILLLLARVIIWLFTSKKCQGVKIEGENGNLFVTTAAIEDFIIRTLADVDDMLIDKVRLVKKGSKYSVVIVIRVSGDSNVSELRPIIENRVLRKTEEKIGIDSITEVNITLKNFSAKESQITKRHKLAMKDSVKKEELESEPKLI